MFIFLIEMKKKLNKKNMLIILSCVVFSLFIALFVYNKSIYTGEIVDNKYKDIYGDEAVAQVLSFSDSYYGFLDENKLINAAKSYNRNVDKNTKRSKPVYENLINSDTCGMIYSFLYINRNRENPLVIWKDDAYIPMGIPQNFYQLRNEEVMNQASKIKATEKVKVMEKELDIPFYVHKTASFWKTIIEFFSILIITAMFISIITSAPSFSETFENGTRDIIINSKYGKKYFAKCRLIATLIYTTLIYFAMVIPYLCFMLVKIGYHGLSTSFQYISLFTSINASIGKVLMFYVISSWVGVLAMVCITLLLSSLIKKTYATGVVSMILVIVTYANSIFFRGGKSTITSQILSITPMNSSEYIFIFSKNQFFDFFGYLMKLSVATVMFYLIYVIVFSVLSIKLYRRVQR